MSNATATQPEQQSGEFLTQPRLRILLIGDLCLLAGLADVLTTYHGLTNTPLVESNPTALWVLENFGFFGLVTAKLMALCVVLIGLFSFEWAKGRAETERLRTVCTVAQWLSGLTVVGIWAGAAAYNLWLISLV